MNKYFILILLFIFSASARAQVAGISNGYLLQASQANIAQITNNDSYKAYAMLQLGPKNELGGLENYYLNLQSKLLKHNMAFSVQFSNLDYKLLHSKTINLALAKRLQLSPKTNISVGVNIGTSRNTINFDNDYGLSVIAEAMKSTSYTSKSQMSANNYDKNQTIFGAALYANVDTWHVGFAVPNMIKNSQPQSAFPFDEQVLERPGFFSLEKDLKLNDKLEFLPSVYYRFSSDAFQKGADVVAQLRYLKKYKVGLAQQRIGQTEGYKPLLAMAEVAIKNTGLAYTINLKSENSDFTNIKQQVMLRVDLDFLGNKQQVKSGK